MKLLFHDGKKIISQGPADEVNECLEYANKYPNTYRCKNDHCMEYVYEPTVTKSLIQKLMRANFEHKI